MATERLKVILEMVTGQYKREASAAARATDGITKSGAAADRSLKGLSNRLSRITPAQAAGIIAAGGAIAFQAGKAVLALDKLGVEADNIRNKFNVVFGEGADDVADWADQVNERFGVSQVAVQDLAANFADLLVPIGFTRDEATGLTQDALQLANALSEWSGGQIDVADASDTIRKALLGEREGLKALNVSILQSDVNARVAANGQAELTGELKAQAEAQATLELITEKSADAINAYETGANKALITQKGLNAAVADSKQILADFVTNEIDDFRDGATLLAFVLEDLTAALQDSNEASDDAADSSDGLVVSLLRQNPLLRQTADLLEPLVENYIESKVAADDAADSTTELGDKIQQAGTQAANAARSTGDYGQDIASIATNAPLAAVGVDAFARALRGQIDPVFRALNAVSAYDQALKDANEDGVITADEAQNVTDAFVDLADAGADLTEADYARFLETAATALNITEDAAEALFEDLDLLSRTEFSVNLVSNLSGNTARRVEAEAEERGTPIRGFGGPVAGGRSYIVGDRGPELFTPSGSGRIIPNVGGSAGGGGVVFHNVFNVSEASSAKSVVREIREQLQRIDREVV